MKISVIWIIIIVIYILYESKVHISHTEQLYLCHKHFLYKSYKEIWDVSYYTWVSFCLIHYCYVGENLFVYLSQTFWVYGFKLFHIVPMPYHWFQNKWKTLRLIICVKLLVQTIYYSFIFKRVGGGDASKIYYNLNCSFYIIFCDNIKCAMFLMFGRLSKDGE